MIKYFNNIEKFNLFISKHKYKKMPFNGSECICYLSEDGFVYKDFLERNLDFDKCKHRDRMVICEEDVSTNYIIFPMEIYSINGKVVGSKENYFPLDLFHGNYQVDFLKEIDYDMLIDAYYRLLLDVKKISELGIRMNDVDFNILFNNSDLCIVDTYHYFKYGSDCEDYNINLISNAVKRQLEFGLTLSHERIDEFSEVCKLDVEDYIKVYKIKYSN